jgi:hypothetical protein
MPVGAGSEAGTASQSGPGFGDFASSFAHSEGRCLRRPRIIQDAVIYGLGPIVLVLRSAIPPTAQSTTLRCAKKELGYRLLQRSAKRRAVAIG